MCWYSICFNIITNMFNKIKKGICHFLGRNYHSYAFLTTPFFNCHISLVSCHASIFIKWSSLLISWVKPKSVDSYFLKGSTRCFIKHESFTRCEITTEDLCDLTWLLVISHKSSLFFSYFVLLLLYSFLITFRIWTFKKFFIWTSPRTSTHLCLSSSVKKLHPTW